MDSDNHPGEIMKQATIADAPAVLNMNDKAMWVLGYNAAVEAAEKERPWPFTGCGGGLAVSDLDEQDSPDDVGVEGKCEPCDGKGVDPTCREETCIVCGGSGMVPDGEIPSAFGNEPIKCVKDCPACKGTPGVLGTNAPEYLAEVEADPRRAAALQRARERADGVTASGSATSCDQTPLPKEKP